MLGLQLLPISPYISLYLPISPHISLYLPISPHISRHLVLGLQLLSTLVTEMNGSANTRSLTQHRKVAGSFRDLALLSILQLALTTLQQLQTGALAATGTWG